MNITDVRVRKLLTEGKMKAIVSVTLDDAFVIHDVKVVDGQNGLFVAMPSRKTPNGEFRDIAHPISQEARDILQQKVLEKYEETLALEEDVYKRQHYCYGATTNHVAPMTKLFSPYWSNVPTSYPLVTLYDK